MRRIDISRGSPDPLVDQIVQEIGRQIRARELPPGTKLPSIRSFATTNDVSRFTVVEAYDRLVAQGYLHSRRGAGFYARAVGQTVTLPDRTEVHNHNKKMVWLIRRLLAAQDGMLLVGGPWLPNAWLEENNIGRTLRGLAGTQGSHLVEYGTAFGYLPLREHIARTLLPEIGIRADVSQVLLTNGSSQALDIISRFFLAPGDAVLVDDPGYYNLFGNLRLQGLRLLGVPRGVDGPDVAVLEKLAATHKPKLYFTQSILQNPTGTTMGPHVAHRVLQIAEQHKFRIVEDDMFSDLFSGTMPRLAALDQLDRVIYVRSFSKTLSGSLRVGFIVCEQALAEELADTKMLTTITTSQVIERLLYRVLMEGHHRKQLARVRERLDEARARVLPAFDRMGLEMFGHADGGMFVWARLPSAEDSLMLADSAAREKVLLAPGTVFRPNLEPSPWMRFNVAVCQDAAVQARLATVLLALGKQVY
jgi:DNA-binding transcriptional MocR family regulator